MFNDQGAEESNSQRCRCVWLRIRGAQGQNDWLVFFNLYTEQVSFTILSDRSWGRLIHRRLGRAKLQLLASSRPREYQLRRSPLFRGHAAQHLNMQSAHGVWRRIIATSSDMGEDRWSTSRDLPTDREADLAAFGPSLIRVGSPLCTTTDRYVQSR